MKVPLCQLYLGRPVEQFDDLASLEVRIVSLKETLASIFLPHQIIGLSDPNLHAQIFHLSENDQRHLELAILAICYQPQHFFSLLEKPALGQHFGEGLVILDAQVWLILVSVQDQHFYLFECLMNPGRLGQLAHLASQDSLQSGDLEELKDCELNLISERNLRLERSQMHICFVEPVKLDEGTKDVELV